MRPSEKQNHYQESLLNFLLVCKLLHFSAKKKKVNKFDHSADPKSCEPMLLFVPASLDPEVHVCKGEVKLLTSAQDQRERGPCQFSFCRIAARGLVEF